MPGGVNINPEVYVVIRLLVPLPVNAAGYQLSADEVTSEICELGLRVAGRVGVYSIARYHNRDRLERALAEGLELELAHVRAITVFAELVRTGRAAVVRGRHCRVTFRTYQLQQIAERAN